MKEKIYNEDCNATMKRMIKENRKVDIILTSPPYNTGGPNTSEQSLKNHNGRYDSYLDNASSEYYCEWVCGLFSMFGKILTENGVVLWNVSYGSDYTQRKDSIGLLWLSIADVIRKTEFVVADKIVWKKKSALPNNASKNKLTRICEDVLVFCRKNEYETFRCNKQIMSVSNKGQNFYSNFFNYISAPNNDRVCTVNKATYSTSFVKGLMQLYADKDSVIYDPFMGSGTTAVACIEKGLHFFGSELSDKQCEYSQKRIDSATKKKAMSFF